MQYVWNNKIYEVDYIQRSLDDEAEIFLIDPDTRQAISIDELPADVADDLWGACSDLMMDDRHEHDDFADLSGEIFQWDIDNE